MFCLQIKRDLADNTLQCNDNTAALMASYIVQGMCVSPHFFVQFMQYLNRFFTLFPLKQPLVVIMWQRIIPITHIYRHIDLYHIKMLPCNEELWKITKNMCKCFLNSKIFLDFVKKNKCFLNFSGQTPAEADLNLLETARRCELYGMRMHPAKDIEGVPLNLAVAHMGIAVFQGITRINTFSWAKIRKISFKRKRFLVKLHPEGYVCCVLWPVLLYPL